MPAAPAPRLPGLRLRALLIGLGVWQLQRLKWKEALLAHVVELQAAKPQALELVPTSDRRTPTAREASRRNYQRLLERVLTRKEEGLRKYSDAWMKCELIEERADEVFTEYTLGPHFIDFCRGPHVPSTKKIKAFLTKLGVYSDLEDLTIKWRLDVESFGNTDSIIDKFLSYKLLSTDHFTKDDIELFVQLLSLVKEKTLKKAELDKLRLNRIRGTPAPVPPSSPPEPATVKADEAVSVSVAPVSVEVTPTESLSEKEINKFQGDMDRIAELLESAEGEDQTMVSVG